MSLFSKIWPIWDSQSNKTNKEIQKLLNIISELEQRLKALESQLELEIASREAVEVLYQDQLNKNKHIVEQNSLFKIKLQTLINKQDKILAVLDIIMQNTNIENEQKDIIYKLLEI